MWEQPLLARYFTRMAEFSRVMIFDKRGMGMSDRAREVPTLEARMDDVRAVMAVGSERAMLSGGGEGARMTALFAATYPERVSAVAFVNPSARGLWSPDYPWAHTETEWRRLLRDVRMVGGLRSSATAYCASRPRVWPMTKAFAPGG